MLEEFLSETIGILVILLLAGLPFVLLHLFLAGKKKGSLVIEKVRLYWRHPRLAFRLSKEQRKEVTEKFLDLVEKNREENDKRTRKIWKEKNAQLPYVIKEIGEK